MRLFTHLRGSIIAAALALATLSPAANAEPVTAGFKDAYADVNGIRLHYVTSGTPSPTRPMMLFVHGFPNFSYYWADQLAEFGKDHFAVAPDMRGYYLSSKPEEVEQYKLKHIIEDIRQLNEKLNGGKKFILVAHDWGGLAAFVFAMHYPELVEKLIVSNAPHPQIFERETKENAWQQFSSNYMIRENGYANADEPPMDGDIPRDVLAKRMETGWVAEQVKLGRFSEADRQKWIDAGSTPGARKAGTNWYRANDLNPPFNATHPASQVKRSWSTKAVTENAKTLILPMPTLIIWGVRDNPLPIGNITGLDHYFTNYKLRLFGAAGHSVTQTDYQEVNKEIRAFLAGTDPVKVAVYPDPKVPAIGQSGPPGRQPAMPQQP